MEKLPWDIRQLGITCIDCDLWEHSWHGFRKHAKSVHQGVSRPQLCRFCPGAAFSRHAMVEHVRQHKIGHHRTWTQLEKKQSEAAETQDTQPTNSPAKKRCWIPPEKADSSGSSTVGEQSSGTMGTVEEASNSVEMTDGKSVIKVGSEMRKRKLSLNVGEATANKRGCIERRSTTVAGDIDSAPNGQRFQVQKCPICKKLVWQLDFHLRSGIHDQNGIHKCQTCSARFFTDLALNRHMLVAHPDAERCFGPQLKRNHSKPPPVDRSQTKAADQSECKSKNDVQPAVGKALTNRHFNSFLKGSNLLCNKRMPWKKRCPRCSRLFRDSYRLSRHMNARRSCVVKKYVCGLCGEALPSSSALYLHYSQKHGVEKSVVLKKKSIAMPKFEPKKTSNSAASASADDSKPQSSVNESFSRNQSTATSSEEPLGRNTDGEVNQDAGIKAQHRAVNGITVPAHTCPLCSKKFLNYQHVKRHMGTRIHAGQSFYKCDLCSESFRTVSKLIQHRERKHKAGNVFKSEGETQERSEFLSAKECDRGEVNGTGGSTSTESVRHKCTKCNKTYPFKYQLRMHLISKEHATRTHQYNMKDESVQYVNCPLCNKVMAKTSLKVHLASRLHNNEKRFQCPQCDDRFWNWTMARNHQKSKHEKVMKVKIPDAPIAMKTASIGNDPGEKDESASSELPTDSACHLCHKTNGINHIKGHLMCGIHGSKRATHCSKCSKTFWTSAALRRHLRRKHGIKSSTQPPLTKESCEPEESFNKVSVSNKSICGDARKPGEVHSKNTVIYNYRSCVFCKNMIRANDLAKHLLTAHRGQKGYECHTCQERFFTNAELLAHGRQKEHIARTYVCNVCGETMTTKYEHKVLHSKMARQSVKSSLVKNASKPDRASNRVSLITPAAHDAERHGSFTAETDHRGGEMSVGARGQRQQSVCADSRKPGDLHWKNTIIRSRRQCPICKQIVSGKKFVQHLATWHPGQKGYECHTCQECFCTNAELLAHGRQKEHIAVVYFCKVCGKTMTTKMEHAMLHRKTQSNQASRAVAFAAEATTQTPGEADRMSRGKNFTCPHCAMLLQGVDDALRHMSSVHSLNLLIRCSICGKAFLSVPELKEHLLLHNIAEEAQLQNTTVCPADGGGDRIGRRFWKFVQEQIDEKLKSEDHSSKKRFSNGGDLCKVEHVEEDSAQSFSHSTKTHGEANDVKKKETEYKPEKGGVQTSPIKSSNRRISGFGNPVVNLGIKVEQCNDIEAYQESHFWWNEQDYVSTGSFPGGTITSSSKNGMYYQDDNLIERQASIELNMLLSPTQENICDVCLEVCESDSSLVNHRCRHFWSGLPQCHHCQATFVLVTHLRKHLRNHSDEGAI